MRLSVMSVLIVVLIGLLRFMAPNEAAGSRAQKTVMAQYMLRDAADQSALEAAACACAGPEATSAPDKGRPRLAAFSCLTQGARVQLLF